MKYNNVQTVYKNLNHRVNRVKFEVFRDVETNPRPVEIIKTTDQSTL